MKEFVLFFKFFLKDTTDSNINDVFMLSNNKLNELTKMLAANRSPNQSRVQEDSFSLDQSMNNPFSLSPAKQGDNTDLMDTSGVKGLNQSMIKEMLTNYGLNQTELNDAR